MRINSEIAFQGCKSHRRGKQGSAVPARSGGCGGQRLPSGKTTEPAEEGMRRSSLGHGAGNAYNKQSPEQNKTKRKSPQNTPR